VFVIVGNPGEFELCYENAWETWIQSGCCFVDLALMLCCMWERGLIIVLSFQLNCFGLR
jgi:hypothetical protein